MTTLPDHVLVPREATDEILNAMADVCSICDDNCGWKECARKQYDALLAASPPTAGSGVDLWRPIETAPKDAFILLYCPEDKSRWLAKWQDDQWYGVDDLGLTRSNGYHKGSGRVTGWEITAWTPLPKLPTARPSHPNTAADDNQQGDKT